MSADDKLAKVKAEIERRKVAAEHERDCIAQDAANFTGAGHWKHLTNEAAERLEWQMIRMSLCGDLLHYIGALDEEGEGVNDESAEERLAELKRRVTKSREVAYSFPESDEKMAGFGDAMVHVLDWLKELELCSPDEEAADERD